MVLNSHNSAWLHCTVCGKIAGFNVKIGRHRKISVTWFHYCGEWK